MPKFIFIIGSTGSGKSTASEEIKVRAAELGKSVTILSLDHYFKTRAMIDSKIPFNYDEPQALQTERLIKHIAQLERKEAVERPTFDLRNGDPLENVTLDAGDIIIIEGIFAGEFINYLNKNTERLQIYINSNQLNDHYTRKLPRDRDERSKTPQDLKQMKKNQMAGFFQYIAPKMNTSNIVLENLWQPSASGINEAIPLFVNEKLAELLKFIKPECGPTIDWKP